MKLRVRAGVPVYIQVAALAHTADGPNSNVDQNTRAHQLAKRLKRGVNLSNWLEVPPDQDWGDNSCDETDFARIALQGFDRVRIPVGWHHYVGPAPDFVINKAIYRKVDRVVDRATSAGLAAILNIHHFKAFTDDPQSQRERLLSIWGQVAAHYSDQPESVFFEILNEPTDRATTESMNEVYADVIKLIRRTNLDRGILVGPGDFNSAFRLNDLKLPDQDKALIVTFYNYDPFQFTHQGATWTSPGVRSLRGIRFPGPPAIAVTPSADADQWTKRWIELFNSIRDPRYNVSGTPPITRMLDVAHGWSERHGRPVHLGEFGAFQTADDVSRATYHRSVSTEAEKRKIGWAVWDWKAGFGYWDRNHLRPKSGMKDALFGP